MKRSMHHALAAPLLAALALGAGCGTQKCKVEQNSLAELPTCLTPVAPGGRVTMQIRVAEKCWQSFPTCTVGMKGDVVALDVMTEACLDPSSCTTPVREVDGESCWFYAPQETGTYQVQTQVMNPDGSESPQSYALIVSNGGDLQVSCFAIQ